MVNEFERMTNVNIVEISNSEPEWMLPILTQSAQQEKLESQRKPGINKVLEILRDINIQNLLIPWWSHLVLITMATQNLLCFRKGRPPRILQIRQGCPGLREYYDEESTNRFSDEEFTRMIFLDGCLLLYSTDRIAKDKPTEDTKIKNNQMAFISRDILLLENQLHFVVLRALMSLNIPGDEGEELVHKVIEKQTTSGSHHSSENQDQDQPLHILHLLWKELVGTEPHFKIQRFQGNLILPAIFVDDITRSMLLNLLAYEACPDFPNDYAVTSYICFMDALIDHSKDVKELRSKGILLNLLGSDEKVADLFNDLATNLVPNPNEYFEMTEMLETHIRSPWTAVGFFVAMVIILLTFVQFFSIFPRGDGAKKSPSRSPTRKIPWND
ncbi:hypothetical protein NE237_009500 [Protea cynaroides]|uniref:Uncharacterized protein n=1 Tax=Protea cynaroides TaxID=273540 RepID=A0A9Q0R0T6_9MAGN|nr:hypothetical protein NE237_009500 [Protea cynaroides]